MMHKIVFFSLPAHGHTNPTIELVHTLTQRGHAVRYYSFDTFRERIEAAGAEYVSCDAYMPPPPKDLEKRVRYDFSSLIGMATQVTLAMEKNVSAELSAFHPDCIVSDSVCLWGKLLAQKLGAPLVCSTTTFAFNDHTAKLMRPGLRELFYTLTGIPKMGRYMRQLQAHGFHVQNVAELLRNDNDTDTIVYTSRAFQPCQETFGDTYAFIGPSLPKVSPQARQPRARPQIYISLGTVLRDGRFYQNCVEAFRNEPYDVVMSVGDAAHAARLQNVPQHFQVQASVPQLKVLQNTDVFITHCGMNSVNESLFFGVPMVLCPQHSEQGAVARRVAEVGAGVMLSRATPEGIRDAATAVLWDKEQYGKAAEQIADSFRAAGGAERGAEKIEAVMNKPLSV